MRNAGLFTATVFCAGIVSGGVSAAPALTASSSAKILSGTVEIGSDKVVIPPQAAASGSGAAAYAARKSLKTYNATISLPDNTSLTVQTGALLDTASSAGVVGSAITAKAGSSMAAATFTLSNPFVSGTVTVKADKIVSSAAFTSSTTGAPAASGAANITNGSIDLSLFGLGVQTYSGKPTKNQVIFKSKDGTVTVFGNRHIIAHAVGSTVPTGITVYAVDVHLDNAKIFGQPVNGDLAVGTSIAR